MIKKRAVMVEAGIEAETSDGILAGNWERASEASGLDKVDEQQRFDMTAAFYFGASVAMLCMRQAYSKRPEDAPRVFAVINREIADFQKGLDALHKSAAPDEG